MSYYDILYILKPETLNKDIVRIETEVTKKINSTDTLLIKYEKLGIKDFDFSTKQSIGWINTNGVEYERGFYNIISFRTRDNTIKEQLLEYLRKQTSVIKAVVVWENRHGED